VIQNICSLVDSPMTKGISCFYVTQRIILFTDISHWILTLQFGPSHHCYLSWTWMLSPNISQVPQLVLPLNISEKNCTSFHSGVYYAQPTSNSAIFNLENKSYMLCLDLTEIKWQDDRKYYIMMRSTICALQLILCGRFIRRWEGQQIEHTLGRWKIEEKFYISGRLR
jgi:hypothetical protein